MLSVRSLEQALRGFRDRVVLQRLARSEHVSRAALAQLEIAVVDCGDHSLAFDPRDHAIGRRILKRKGWYRAETLAIFAALPRRGGVFVDVGANIGTQTVYALKHGGFDRAVCFEPSPANARILRVNAVINGLADRVTVIEKAVGAEPGMANLYLHGQNHGAHSLVNDHGGRAIPVVVTTAEAELAALGIAAEEIGLAWIDAEGFEGAVLAGWPSLKGRPVCLEYAPHIQPLATDTFAGWSRWAEPDQPPIVWRPIAELDMTRAAKQLNLLFA